MAQSVSQIPIFPFGDLIAGKFFIRKAVIVVIVRIRGIDPCHARPLILPIHSVDGSVFRYRCVLQLDILGGSVAQLCGEAADIAIFNDYVVLSKADQPRAVVHRVHFRVDDRATLDRRRAACIGSHPQDRRHFAVSDDNGIFDGDVFERGISVRIAGYDAVHVAVHVAESKL